MLIRSQDKKKIVSIEGLEVLLAANNQIIAFGVNNPKPVDHIITLGKYSTEKKAIKVLDMICLFADSKHYETIMPERYGRISGMVFEMPKDEDVEVK